MCRSTLQKVADPKKNISMHKIPFFGKERPLKKKRRKRWFNICVGEEKDMGTGEKVLFQNTGPKIHTCLILDANCYCYFLSSYINAGHILEFIFTYFFSLFSWLSWFAW